MGHMSGDSKVMNKSIFSWPLFKRWFNETGGGWRTNDIHIGSGLIFVVAGLFNGDVFPVAIGLGILGFAVWRYTHWARRAQSDTNLE
jgi:hypothetical protein